MAGRKSTKVEDEVKNEVLEQKAEETVAAEAETKEEVTEEVEAEQEETEDDTHAPLVEEGTKEPSVDDVIDGETKELISEVESVGETLNSEELQGAGAEEAISKELEHVEEIEKKLKEKVNESVKNIKTVRNDQFRNFWCGVSDGWNN